MDTNIIEFILNSKWYDYRKAVKNKELNNYGKEMGQSLSDELNIAMIYLTSVVNEQPLPLQRYTVLKLDLEKLKDEFFNINVKYKLESIEEPYQDREQMFSGWYK